MKLKYTLPSIAAAAILMACSAQVDKATDAAKSATADVKNVAANAADMAKDAITPGADISTLPSGVYKSENTHAYVAFSYWHQDYSKPILLWDKFDATVNLNADNPESSTVNTLQVKIGSTQLITRPLRLRAQM